MKLEKAIEIVKQYRLDCADFFRYGGALHYDTEIDDAIKILIHAGCRVNEERTPKCERAKK